MGSEASKRYQRMEGTRGWLIKVSAPGDKETGRRSQGNRIEGAQAPM